MSRFDELYNKIISEMNQTQNVYVVAEQPSLALALELYGEGKRLQVKQVQKEGQELPETELKEMNAWTFTIGPVFDVNVMPLEKWKSWTDEALGGFLADMVKSAMVEGERMHDEGFDTLVEAWRQAKSISADDKGSVVMDEVVDQLVKGLVNYVNIAYPKAEAFTFTSDFCSKPDSIIIDLEEKERVEGKLTFKVWFVEASKMEQYKR